jgi:hypothetical protein
MLICGFKNHKIYLALPYVSEKNQSSTVDEAKEDEGGTVTAPNDTSVNAEVSSNVTLV